MTNEAIRTMIEPEQLEAVTGGTVTKKYTPKNNTSITDQIINDESYEAIARWAADKLNPNEPRKRKVDNTQKINDYLI